MFHHQWKIRRGSGLPKFKPEEFETADDGFKNLCAQKVGALQTPLKYVIRDAQTPVDFVDDQERRMYQVQLAGRAYEEDNRTVYRMLKEFLFNTAGWAWIQSYDATENGRDAYWAWVNHYNGQGELSKRMQMAKAEIKVLHYKREEAMDFEMYSNKLNRAFQVLDKDPDQRKSAAQKVEILLEGIKTTDTELVACKAVIMQSHASDYDAACAYFSAQVSCLHGGAQIQKQRLKRRIASMESAGRGRGRFERGGSGRFGRGGRSGRGGRGYRGGGGRGPTEFYGDVEEELPPRMPIVENIDFYNISSSTHKDLLSRYRKYAPHNPDVSLHEFVTKELNSTPSKKKNEDR